MAGTREAMSEALKDAMKAREARVVSTLRMALSKLKDKDIEARGEGRPSPIEDAAVLGVLQGMIKQRRESIALYRQGGRVDLADQEAEEITVLERFLPTQMDEAASAAAIAGVIAELGAGGMKDMGRVMAALRERFAGQMDFSRASATIKELLGRPA